MLVIASRPWRRVSVEGVGNDTPIRPLQLLLLSYIGVIVHVLMDLMNTYGVRLLMPFSQRWFYGDVLFIVDPWLWAIFAAGIWLTRRRHAPNWSRASLAVATVYVLAMILNARAAGSPAQDRPSPRAADVLRPAANARRFRFALHAR